MHVDKEGYVRITVGYVPGAWGNAQKHEHVVVAERALGKPLPAGAQVHHVNGDRTDNRPSNLVVCQNQAYHGLLHRRTRAKRASGHASWRQCRWCKEWASPDNPAFHIGESYRSAWHRSCERAARARRNSKRTSQGLAS